MPSQLDFRHSRHWHLKTTPDVLIMPSRLATLAKDVLDTLIINPGSLSRGTTGGTYADVSIHPFKEDELRDAMIVNEERDHATASRSCVNIIKI
jgi:DNA polymerase alpha subunit B